MLESYGKEKLDEDRAKLDTVRGPAEVIVGFKRKLRHGYVKHRWVTIMILFSSTACRLCQHLPCDQTWPRKAEIPWL